MYKLVEVTLIFQTPGYWPAIYTSYKSFKLQAFFCFKSSQLSLKRLNRLWLKKCVIRLLRTAHFHLQLVRGRDSKYKWRERWGRTWIVVTSRLEMLTLVQAQEIWEKILQNNTRKKNCKELQRQKRMDIHN